MNKRMLLPAVLLLAVCGSAAADSLWERRDLKNAYLFNDYRARLPGDVLTILLNEVTEFEGQDKRELNKQTLTSGGLNLSGAFNAGKLTKRSFSGNFDGQGTSQRKFDSYANSTIDRKFADRMTVVVVGVLPNGNLLVEGMRRHVVNKELRTLRVSGIVRPGDIGPFNTVLSQYVGNLQAIYDGRGPESNSTNRGWLGKAFNVLWPF